MKRKLQRITNLVITIIFVFTQTFTPVLSAYAPGQTDLQVVETIEQTVSPESEAVVVLGEAKLEIPIGAVTEPVEIKIEKLQQVAELNPGLDNVTGGAAGYRFKPDGQRFTQPVKVTLPYDKRLVAGDGRVTDPYTYFYNTETKHWERLERVAVDEEKWLNHQLDYALY